MSGYEGVCICYMAYVCSARWLFFGYFPGECSGTPSGKNSRIYLLRAGVKIVSAVALFHSFGVARQGPWITWVNKGRTDAWGANEWRHVRADNELRREGASTDHVTSCLRSWGSLPNGPLYAASCLTEATESSTKKVSESMGNVTWHTLSGYRLSTLSRARSMLSA